MKKDADEMEMLLRSIESDSEIVELGKMIGSEALRVVLSMLGGPLGMQVYIPSTESFIAALRRELRDKDIRAYYNGTPASITALASRYKITKTRVRQIIVQGR